MCPRILSGKSLFQSILSGKTKSLGLQTFWNDKLGFMTETTVTNLKKDGRSGYGAAPLTVSVFNFDPTLGCDPKTFQPCSDRALSSLKVVGDAFRESYPINKKLPPDQFPYYGMFLEDQLNGGQVRESPPQPFRAAFLLTYGSSRNSSRR